MIFTRLATWFFDFVAGMINLFPTIRLPATFISLLEDVTYIFSTAAYFLPIGSILTCLSIIFLVDNFKIVVSIFNWCVSKIPMIK